MTLYGYNDLIRHFAGYIHIGKEIGTIRADYDEAVNLSPTVRLGIAPLPDDGGKTDGDDGGGGLSRIANIPGDTAFQPSGNLLSGRVPDVLFQNPDPTNIAESVFDADIAIPAVDTPDYNPPDTFTISLLYRIAGPQNYTFDLASLNELTDNDWLIDEGIKVDPVTGESVAEILEDGLLRIPSDDYVGTLKELADGQVPDFLEFDANGVDLEAITMELADAFAARTLAIAAASAGSDAEDSESAPPFGPILSGETVIVRAGRSDDGNGGDGEGGQLPPGGTQSATLDENEDGPALSGNAGEIDGPIAGMAANDDDGPAPDQAIHLGSNEAVNAASIVDTSEAGASIVVLGDYFENNVIVQTNIYSFNDNQNVGAGAVGAPGGEEIAAIANSVGNEADMTRATGEALVPAPLGFSLPSYTFHVDYVVGDFFDLNVISQTNTLIDNDTVVFETSTSQYFIETGDNSLVNAAQIVDLFQQYDMIFVGGSYYEINYIRQTNIVLDADNVTLRGFGDSPGYDGNVLQNDATIRNIGGGELFKPLTPDIEALTESITGRETELAFTNSDLDFGMAANLPSSVNVLYITGDFYQLNAIVQTNILIDVDNGLILNGDPANDGLMQNVAAADNEPSGDPIFETGENLASNRASIVDYDSQSEFQYLGGTFYEHDVLIQVDIIAPEDETIQLVNNGGSGALVNEAIAFAGESGSDTAPAPDPLFIPAGEAGDGGDMLGAMMT